MRRPNLGTPLDAVGQQADRGLGDVSETLAQRDELQSMLDVLEERYRLPLLMVFLEGMTCQETADTLGIPLGTVLSRIHRARKFLRKQLDKEDMMTQEHNEIKPPLRLGGSA